MDSAAERIGRVLDAGSDEIIFTSGATEANNLAIAGLAARAIGKRRILVSAAEHKCVLASAAATKHFGLIFEVLPVDMSGYVDLDILERLLSDDVLLVSVMAANNEIGTLQPLTRVIDLAHKAGALVHTDAAQLLTDADIALHELNVDLASFSAHKVYGPKVIGALFIRRDVQRLVEPQIVGGGQQSGLRSGTVPVPLCVGLAEAPGGAQFEALYAEWLENRAQCQLHQDWTQDEDDRQDARKTELARLITSTPTSSLWMILVKIEVLEYYLSGMEGGGAWADNREFIMLAGIKADLRCFQSRRPRDGSRS